MVGKRTKLVTVENHERVNLPPRQRAAFVVYYRMVMSTEQLRCVVDDIADKVPLPAERRAELKQILNRLDEIVEEVYEETEA